jgi:hypothetical protein
MAAFDISRCDWLIFNWNLTPIYISNCDPIYTIAGLPAPVQRRGTVAPQLGSSPPWSLRRPYFDDNCFFTSRPLSNQGMDLGFHLAAFRAANLACQFITEFDSSIFDYINYIYSYCTTPSQTLRSTSVNRLPVDSAPPLYAVDWLIRRPSLNTSVRTFLDNIEAELLEWVSI